VVSNPILIFLAVDAVALLLLGACAMLLPLRAAILLATGLSGFGTLLSLLPLLGRLGAAALTIPVGPPSLSLHLALDPLSACFLLLIFSSSTAVVVYHARCVTLVQAPLLRQTALCLGGATLAMLAADGVSLTIGLAVIGGAVSVPDRLGRAPLLIPLLLLAAICLLTPADFVPRFDTIRAAPIGSGRAAVAAALAVAAATALAWATQRWPTSVAVTAGLFVPTTVYLMVRILADLAASAAQGWWGVGLMFVGGSIAVIQSWQSAAHPDIDGSIMCLMRRQTGLAMIGIGLAIICRVEDLPAAASFAFGATFLLTISGSTAGTAAAIAASAIRSSAGTGKLSGLGGLVHSMPWVSGGLAAALFALSALPAGVGFACLWLLLEAILSAPRTGGVLSQIPLALAAAAIALSAALATTAAARIIGIALLGRPRSPSGAGARESNLPIRAALWMPAGIALFTGIFPGPTLWLLADPPLGALAGIPPGTMTSLSVMPTGSFGYMPLPVLALVALAAGAVVMAQRWTHREAKVAGPWTGGMAPPAALPFGEPAAQSTGEGFLPPHPDKPLAYGLRLPARPKLRSLSPIGLIWIVLCGFGILLLILGVNE
jgi:hydrogenase-4 component B